MSIAATVLETEMIRRLLEWWTSAASSERLHMILLRTVSTRWFKKNISPLMGGFTNEILMELMELMGSLGELWCTEEDIQRFQTTANVISGFPDELIRMVTMSAPAELPWVPLVSNDETTSNPVNVMQRGLSRLPVQTFVEYVYDLSGFMHWIKANANKKSIIQRTPPAHKLVSYDSPTRPTIDSTGDYDVEYEYKRLIPCLIKGWKDVRERVYMTPSDVLVPQERDLSSIRIYARLTRSLCESGVEFDCHLEGRQPLEIINGRFTLSQSHLLDYIGTLCVTNQDFIVDTPPVHVVYMSPHAQHEILAAARLFRLC